MKLTFTLAPAPHPARQNAAKSVLEAPEGYIVTIQEPTRNLEQNAAMWVILTAWSKQKEWPVNGQMVKLTPEDWKEILTASFDREMVRIAQGLDGGMVLLGHRTSKWGRKRFSEWLEFLHAASAHHGVEIEPATVPEPLGRAS